MIKLKMSIEDISEYQTGILPKNAVKIETPQSIEEMMKKAAPIKTTMDRYVHVTDESLAKAVQQFEAATPIVEKRV